jgi:predicted peptidase
VLPLLGPGVHEQTVVMPSVGLLRYTVAIPLRHDGQSSRPLMMALHYGGEVTPFYGRGVLSLVRSAGEHLGAITVAPDALGGVDWSTPQNEAAVVWLARSFQRSYAIDAKRVVLTGFGIGGQGTWYLAGRHQDLFTAAIPIAGEPAGGTAQWTIPLCAINSEHDLVRPLERTEKEVEALKTKGVKAELKVVSGVGHGQTIKYHVPLREAIYWVRDAWGPPPPPPGAELAPKH